MKSAYTLLIACIFSSIANGQSKSGILRKGFVFGTSFGIANTNLSFPGKDQHGMNLGLNWKLGYMLNPKLALLANGAVSIYEYSLTDRKRLRDFGGVFASAQYFATDRISLLGGVGIGTDAPVFYDLRSENKTETEYYSGLGLVGSLGYEIYHKKNFAIDLQGRINYSSVHLPIGTAKGLTVGILLGINFY